LLGRILNLNKIYSGWQSERQTAPFVNRGGFSFDGTRTGYNAPSERSGPFGLWMRAGLQAQLTRLQSDQSRLEQEIPQLQRDLENATAQLTQFTQHLRD
jgi:hypothetical protein